MCWQDQVHGRDISTRIWGSVCPQRTREPTDWTLNLRTTMQSIFGWLRGSSFLLFTKNFTFSSCGSYYASFPFGSSGSWLGRSAWYPRVGASTQTSPTAQQKNSMPHAPVLFHLSFLGSWAHLVLENRTENAGIWTLWTSNGFGNLCQCQIIGWYGRACEQAGDDHCALSNCDL